MISICKKLAFFPRKKKFTKNSLKPFFSNTEHLRDKIRVISNLVVAARDLCTSGK